MTKRNYAALATIFIVNITLFFLFRHAPLKVDEQDYYPQIIKYTNGDYTLNPLITAFPTYHALLAVISKIAGISTIVFFRAVNMVFAFGSIIVFTLIVIKLQGKERLLGIIQFSFFPIIFPYFFLIYTDILSLLAVLSGLYFLLYKKYHWCALFAVFACLVRQNNIVWLLFFFLLSYTETYGYKFSLKNMLRHSAKYWLFTAGILSFITFVIINKGIAMGDRSMHPPFAIQLGNIYFFLFAFFFLFLPLNIANFSKVKEMIAKHRFIIPGILLFYCFFIFTFHNSHPFNYQWGGYFLRNKLLIFFNSSLLYKSVFFVFSCYALLSLCVTKLKSKSYYLLYLMSFLYLIPSWLIEQRYYMVPFAFFLLFKREDKQSVEMFTTLWFVSLSAICYLIISSNRFFL